MPTDTPEPLSDAVPKYSAREIADWRKKHVPIILRGPEPQKHCGFDDAPWPCFTIAALNGWDALKAAREELEQARADIMELLAAKLPEGTTLHRMATTYPKMRQRMLSDADNEIAKLRQRAESAEADCAALREQMSRATGVIGCEGYVDDEFEAVLAQPNPGAGVLERLRQLEALRDAVEEFLEPRETPQEYWDADRRFRSYLERGFDASEYTDIDQPWRDEFYLKEWRIAPQVKLRAALAQAGEQEQAT